MSIKLPFLDEINPIFPSPETALYEPDGLVAAGGNLNPLTLRKAYQQGIFPWYEDNQPILWWSPRKRTVISPGDIHISRSLKKVIRQQQFDVTSDRQFSDVLQNCAAPRNADTGTWITNEMIHAYHRLHEQGDAHSIEVWQNNTLVGGLYGVCVGSVFCGESMFSKVSNASKLALVALTQTLFKAGFSMIDCQISNPHLTTMGCKEIPRELYLQHLHASLRKPCEWPTAFTCEKN